MPSRIRNLVKVAGISGLILAGGFQLGQGSYIKIKAKAADWLISTTWAGRDAASMPAKPWPWADTWVKARMEIPRLGISQFIMKDPSGESLAFGPGFIKVQSAESPLHIIAGHRDTHFRFLADLKVGDIIRMENHTGSQKAFRVSRFRVIDTRDDLIEINPDQGGLMLITCYPFDSLNPGGPMRYLVDAVPVIAKL